MYDEPIKKDPELFDLSPSRIPVFQTNMANTSRVESNRGIRSTRYSTRGRVTRPRSINFTIRLLLT